MPRKPSETTSDPVRVDGYGPEAFTVSGRRIRGPIILRGSRVFAWTECTDAGLGGNAAQQLLGDLRAPGIVLVGTGRARLIPSPSFVAWFRRHGLEPELMVTGAACRTWNVLAAEGREVAAGLIPASWGSDQVRERQVGPDSVAVVVPTQTG